MRRVLLLSLALLACTPKPQYPECRTDEECKDHGQVCLAGFCKECRDDASCPAAKPVCRDALCIAKPECAASKDCPAGQKCAGEKCVPECAEATAAQDCAGKRCLEGRCAAEEECLADADCGDGKACVNSRCKAQGDVLKNRLSDQVGDCTVKAIFFGFDEATLSQDARKALDEDWECLQKTPFRRLLLSGHTDERGTTEYNLALGERRADAVKKYLSGLGAEARKLKAISYGKERPADAGHDDAAFSRNRRVELLPEAPTP